jgi:hypothetical protein
LQAIHRLKKTEVFTHENEMPQGLGTGWFYVENVPSDLTVKEGRVFMMKKRMKMKMYLRKKMK